MYLKLLRYVVGYVKFTATGVFFERFFNLISHNHLSVWDIKIKDSQVYAYCSLRDFKEIEKIATNLEIRIDDVHKIGVPMKLSSLKARIGLIVGIIMFIASIFIFNSFIWAIEIVDYDPQKSQFLLDEMKSLGVHKGVYIKGLDLRQVQQELLIRFEDLSWLTLNRVGTKITVELAKKTNPPTIKSKVPADIIASKTGIITYMEVYSGEATVKLHDVVVAGDMLVSREVKTPTKEVNPDGTFVENIRLVNADAKIIAQTTQTHSISFSYKQDEKKYLNESQKRRFLNIFGVKIPLFIAFDFEHKFDETIIYNPLVIASNELPLGIYEKNFEFYDIETVTYTKPEALEIINKCYADFEKETLANSKILSYSDKINENENSITIEREYICEENIAKKTT